jgi:tRNA (guanosine-2'-O-)-methyltransferase
MRARRCVAATRCHARSASTDGATRLGDLAAATVPTVVLLGHEHHGVADDVWTLVDEVVEIPMVGMGSSLNVAVAGSLVAYRLAGMF